MKRLCLAASLAVIPLLALAQERKGPDADPNGICVHLASNAVLDKAARAGIVWLRTDFNWNILEPQQKGRFAWDEADRIVARARANGQRIYATIAYAPGWANGGREGAYPALNRQDWYDFVHAIVSRYKADVKHWGMWNEPNLDHFYKGTRQQYCDDILALGADAAKAADPTCFVLGPELAHLSSGKWDEWLHDVLVRAGHRIDIVSHHIYKGDARENYEHLDGKPLAKVSVKAILDRFGRGQELWLTETGWKQPETSESGQASRYREFLEGLVGRAYLTRVFFYEVIDDPNIPQKWGILRSDLSEKPAYAEYAAFTASHKGFKDYLSFDAATLSHNTGRAVPGGWEAGPGHAAGHMVFGPYTTLVPGGTRRTAVYRLRVDATTPVDEIVASLDVNDATQNRVLASRDLKRGDFRSANEAQQHWLGFEAPAGGKLEFRVYYHGRGTVKAERIEVRPGSDVKGGAGCAVLPGEGSVLALLPLALVLLGAARRRVLGA